MKGKYRGPTSKGQGGKGEMRDRRGKDTGGGRRKEGRILPYQ